MKIASLIFILSFTSFNANAFDFSQDPKTYKKKISKRSGASLSERTFKLMTRAQEDLSSGATDRAFAALKKLEERTQGAPGEQAQVVQALAFAYAQKEQNDLALKNFERALELDALPEAPTLSVISIVAQLYMMKSQFKKTESAANFLIKVADKPDGATYALLAGALYEQKKKEQALVAIQKAIDLTSRPKESWLAMAVSLYFANERYKEAAKILKILVATSPGKETYWKQWAASHLSANEEKEGLVAIELGNIAGTMAEDKSVKDGASLMLSTDLPYKAAMWMEKKLSKKELGTLAVQKQLASAYMSARENKKAVEVLKQIHKNSPELKMSIQLGQILLEEEKWSEAETVLQKASTMDPDISSKEQIYVALGVAYYNQEKLEESRQSFMQVADKSDAAQGWLSFIQTEEANRAAQIEAAEAAKAAAAKRESNKINL